MDVEFKGRNSITDAVNFVGELITEIKGVKSINTHVTNYFFIKLMIPIVSSKKPRRHVN